MHLCPFFAEITKGGKEEMSFFLVDGATVRDGGNGYGESDFHSAASQCAPLD